MQFRSVLAAAVLAACNGSTSAPSPEPAPASQPASAPASRPAAAASQPAAPSGDEALFELARHGPDLTKFPQADAVLALADEEVTLGKDGSVVEHHHTIVRILDAQRGKARFADVHIPYDSKRQKLEIKVARTLNRDGKATAASPEEISDIVPPQLAEATVYSAVRERVVSFPAVDTTSVVELDWVRTSAPGPDTPLGDDVLLADWDPILSRTLRITVPAGAKVNLSVQGSDLKPVESDDAAAGTHSYTFVEKDVPDRQPEFGSPPEEAVLPRVVYSFQPDWKTAAAAVSDRFMARVTAPSAAIKAKADELVKGLADDQKAQAIYRFVSRDIHSIDLELGAAGYEPTAPEAVLANRYGDGRDKVALFLALCHAVGIEGHPVLVRSGGVPVIESVPSVAQFDRIVAVLDTPAGPVWVTPSDEDGAFGLAYTGQDNLVLGLAPGGGELVKRPLLDPKTSVSGIDETITVSDAGDLDVQYRYALSGLYARRALERLRPLKGENLVQYFQTAATSMSPAAIDTGHKVGDLETVTGSVEIEQHVSAAKYAPAQGQFRVLELPSATLDFAGESSGTGLSMRKLPLWLDTPRTVHKTVRIALPRGWKVAYVPADLSGGTDAVSYQESCAVKEGGVTCELQLVIKQLEIAADQYEAYRAAMIKLEDYKQHFILLTRG